MEFDVLNEKGKQDLEIILSILIKERGIKHSPLLANVASLMLLFMKTGEVFFSLSALLEKSEEILKAEDQKTHMRYHFTFNKI